MIENKEKTHYYFYIIEKEDDQNSTVIPMTLFNVLDLPLCIIADTTLLPQTLYWNICYTKEEREQIIGEKYIRTRDEKRKNSNLVSECV